MKENYSKLTIKNKNFIKRISHSKRYEYCQKIILKYKPNNVLDFGTGDGEFIKFIFKIKNIKIIGYEPDEDLYLQANNNLKKIKNKIRLIQNLKGLKKFSFDMICVNEVLEHLNKKNLNKCFKEINQLLKKDGILVISVPIEVGLSSLLKNFIRIITNQKHNHTTLKNIIKSFLYLKIKRPNINYNDSHIGFNYIEFIKLIKKKNYFIQEKIFSPMPKLKGFLNSQIYLVVRNK